MLLKRIAFDGVKALCVLTHQIRKDHVINDVIRKQFPLAKPGSHQQAPNFVGSRWGWGKEERRAQKKSSQS